MAEDDSDGPPDPQLDPSKSPGFGADIRSLADIEVDRDVTIGEATPEELTASDTSPVAGESVDTLISHLVGGSTTDRRRAALALAESPSTEGREALATAARTDPDADVRQFSVESLGKLGGEIAEASALAASADEDPWVRAEAIVALDRLGRDRFVDRLEAALDDHHHAVRRNATISLFKLRGESLRDVLLGQLDDPSVRVREWAAHMLGGVDDDRVRAALEQVPERDESHIVRATAERALEVDPDRFRRRFAGAMDPGAQPLPGEDRLNRQPDL